MEYLARNFGQRFDADTIRNSIETAAKTALAIRQKGHLHVEVLGVARTPEVPDLETTQGSVEEFAYSLIDDLSDPLKTPSLLEEMADFAAYRDVIFLGPHPRTDGRGKELSLVSRPQSDNHLSHWVYFGLMAQSTGMAEYDQMFQDMVVAAHGIDNHDFSRHSKTVIEHHLAHHPEQEELLPEWARVRYL